MAERLGSPDSAAREAKAEKSFRVFRVLSNVSWVERIEEILTGEGIEFRPSDVTKLSIMGRGELTRIRRESPTLSLFSNAALASAARFGLPETSHAPVPIQPDTVVTRRNRHDTRKPFHELKISVSANPILIDERQKLVEAIDKFTDTSNPWAERKSFTFIAGTTSCSLDPVLADALAYELPSVVILHPTEVTPRAPESLPR